MYTITAYKCEHCSKVLQTKGAMSNHERSCWNNPANKHKCFQWCENLQRKLINAELGQYTEFTCKVTGQKMYSYKAQYNRRIDKTGLTRMPLDCDKFEYNEKTPF